MNNSGAIYFPGLNGLRAIAAICVLIGHTFQPWFADWGVSEFYLPVFGHGMTMFFVISGFLITYLLLVSVALQYVMIYVISILATILAAHLSYKYFEKFFLKFKTNFAVVNSWN